MPTVNSKIILFPRPSKLLLLQTMVKLSADVIHNKKIVTLKMEMLMDARNTSEEDFGVEEKYRKTSRLVLLTMILLFFGFIAFAFLYSITTFTLAFQVQLPWTK